MTDAPLRLALVGDRSPDVRAHARIPLLLEAVARQGGPAVDALWIGTETVDETFAAGDYGGVWLTPGSPYRSLDGALAAVRSARESGTPFLGTCGGFQHALVEYARDVAGIEAAGHAEYGPDDEAVMVIEPLVCSLVGEEGTIQVKPGTLAEHALGVLTSVERYHCAYGPVGAHVEELEAAGLAFTAFDDDGHPRILELPGHPFFLATLFQPELASDTSYVHPIVRAFLSAVAAPAVGVANVLR
jgi:CTP synthase (UTP-ammonia lyase)